MHEILWQTVRHGPAAFHIKKALIQIGHEKERSHNLDL